jgi:AdoMet-dependent rRNA methyltransferase SPB1
VLNKFFNKVIITKPLASRNQSAETFVVCSGYLAPTFIDERLFDPTLVFKDTEADHQMAQMNKEITSMDKLMESYTNRSRVGYADDAPMHLYREVSLEPFIQADNPFPIFKGYNRMIITDDEK